VNEARPEPRRGAALRLSAARAAVVALLLWQLVGVAPELARLPARDLALYRESLTASRAERLAPHMVPYTACFAALQREIAEGRRIVVLARLDLGHERVVQAMRAALFPARVSWYQVFLRELAAGRERFDERLCVVELEGAPPAFLAAQFHLEQQGRNFKLWRYRGARP
jgi:hypothetical protein